MDRETLRELIPAYALGVLDADEKRQVEALLAEDAESRQLLSEYQMITESVALIAPARKPPEELKRKLLRRAKQKRMRSMYRNLLAAAAVIILVLFGGILLSRQMPRELTNAQVAYEQIVSDPKGMQIALIPDQNPEIVGQLAYLQNENRAVIRVSGVPPLDDGEIYQLWLVDDDGAVSGGLYHLTQETNYIEVPITKPAPNYTRFGVSLEPETGSPYSNRPSGPRVFNIPLH